MTRPDVVGSFALLLGLAAAGCAGTANYIDPRAPRYAGRGPTVTDADTIDVVSYNIQFARRVDRALALLRADPALRRADLVLLQEMDAPGTRALAHALDLEWVYYPVSQHPQTGRDFGNAILSRWRIEEDRKILLPHAPRLGGTRRIAVAATLRVGGERLRVYSLHLATPLGSGPRARRQQLEAVLADAESYDRVILGGDFNSEALPEVAEKSGYTWVTRDAGPTSRVFALDHVLVRGLSAVGARAAGVVVDTRGVSDHHPIWARVLWRP